MGEPWNSESEMLVTGSLAAFIFWTLVSGANWIGGFRPNFAKGLFDSSITETPGWVATALSVPGKTSGSGKVRVFVCQHPSLSMSRTRANHNSVTAEAPPTPRQTESTSSLPIASKWSWGPYMVTCQLSWNKWGDRNTIKGAWSCCRPLPSAQTGPRLAATPDWWESASDKPQVWETLGGGRNIICKQLGSHCSFSAVLRS